MGKKIRLISIFFTCLFIPIQFNGQTNKQSTEAGKVIEKVVDIGEKGWKLIKGYGEDKRAYPYDNDSEINPFNRRIGIKINN